MTADQPEPLPESESETGHDGAAAQPDLATWSQSVASWRREVHALYAEVRAASDPAAAHAGWVRARTTLFDQHPATVKGADLGREEDAWVVDLNFAYNPSCAYDPRWACPLAPAGNRLTADVPVGELVGT